MQLVVKMEDERTHHPLMKVPPVDLAPLPRAVAATPGLKLQLLNCPVPPATEAPGAAGAVGGGVLRHRDAGGRRRGRPAGGAGGADRVLFGTHFPLFHAESALLKLKESALAADVEEAVRAGNAKALVPKP